MPPTHFQTLTADEFETRISKVEECLKEGFLPKSLKPTKATKRTAVVEAGYRLGIGRHAVPDALVSPHCPRQPDWSLYVPDVKEIAEPAPVERVDPNTELAKRNRQLEEELSRARADLRAALRRADTAEDIRGGVFNLGNIPELQVKWPQIIVPEHTLLDPVLFTSDLQVGEVIDPDELDGMNEYNQDVFVERYQRLIDRTIDLDKFHVGPHASNGIYYLRGGDEISNSIHKELLECNDLSAVPAIRLLMQHEREGIRRLRSEFGRVHVVSIPGNHDRTDFKPQSSKYTENSFATLLSWWLESVFDGDPNVTFQTPKSGDAFFQVQGHNFLLAHGDRMGSRGGQGFVGPVATIARGHQRLFQNWAKTGLVPRVILTGHLHTAVQTEHGFGNGCLPGYSPYARDLQMKPDQAKQLLLFVHAKRCVSAQYWVQLSDYPVRTGNVHMPVAA